MSVLWKAAVHHAIIYSSHLQSDVSDMTSQGFLVTLSLGHIYCFIRAETRRDNILNRGKFPLNSIHIVLPNATKCQ